MKKVLCKTGLLLGILMMFLLRKPDLALAASNIRQTDIGETTAEIKWDMQSGESSYLIYTWIPESYWDGNTLYTNYKSVNYSSQKPEYKFTELKAGETYKVVIWALDEEENPLSSCEGSMKTSPGKIEKLEPKLKWSSYYQMGTSAKMSYNMYVDFATQSSADGYEIQILNAKGKLLKKATAKQQDTSLYRYSYKNLKENCYLVRMRAYTTFNGKKIYGKWSAKSYAFRQPLSAAKAQGNKLYIRWEKISNATGYNVYLCDKKFGEYKLAASANKKKNMVSITKYGKKKLKKGKRYYYYVEAKKKIGKKTYVSYLSRRFYVQM